ncbi:hypothetical protein BJY04DRAFT_227365 [Aspergillus karnatakaensis]|uniref:uncharacterized protein n=1 Tax=Aspergillus karnatakaensis TaxID=1810916 RepID=UPI003CCD43FB
MARRERSSSDGYLRAPVKWRKRRTSDYPESLSRVSTLEGVQESVMRELLNRLSENGVNTEDIVPAMLKHCLPATTTNINYWETLLHSPLKLSDRMLMDIFHAKVVQQTIVYIRSFHMTTFQLRAVATHLHDECFRHPKIMAWLDATHSMKPEEEVFVRYVGRTTRHALQRHREDLLTRRAGFLAKFLTCLDHMFPTVIDSVVLFTFPAQHLRVLPEVARFNQIAEQAVIALFGICFLLNQTLTRTSSWDFKPSTSYRKQFQALQTRTLSRLLPSRFHRPHEQGALSTWADDIQRMQSSIDHPFTKEARDMILRQAIPAMLDGDLVLLVTVGAGISYQAYRDNHTFYESSSDSATLIKAALNRLWAWEREQDLRSGSLQDLVSAGGLPFVDLCPWLTASGEHLIAAAGFLKHYIALTNPHIVLTFSEKPSSIIASGAMSTGKKCSSAFWSRVGRLELVQLEGHSFIQLPCFHPGQGRFSVNPEVFLIVLDMTLWVLLLTISVTLDSVGLFKDQNRNDWCKYTKANVEDMLNCNGFYREFDALKRKLYAERSKPAAPALIPKGRSRIAIATRRSVDQFIFSGFAVDTPMSDRRRQQTYHLWELGIPELHLHISRDSPREWFMWSNSLEEGASLFVDAIATAIWDSTSSKTLGGEFEITDLSRRNSLLDKYALSSDYRDILRNGLSKRWVSYEDVLRVITAEISTSVPLWEHLHASMISRELSRSGILRFRALYRSQLNGAQVAVWKNCSFPIYWLAPCGRKDKFVMRAPLSSLDTSLGQRRYIFFTSEGIDLRDETGKSCLVRKEALSSTNSVTFPVCHLPNCQDTAESGMRLVGLWEFETGLSWADTTSVPPQVPVDSTTTKADNNCHPQDFYTGNGLCLVRSNWSEQKLLPYQGEPQPADELWLLWMCLREHWPGGGVLFIGLPEKWPSRQDNIWVHFREFLTRPTYVHHPKLTRVQAWTQDLLYTHKTSQMIRNLELLCNVTSKKKIQVRDHERVKTEGKDVKIAGTELMIRHKW